MRVLWHMLYIPMTLVWWAVCILHMVIVGLWHGLDWVADQLYPGMEAVSRRADGDTQDDTDDMARSK